MTRPMFDHGILSPSGRVSKRARKAALARAAKDIFPDGLARPTCLQLTMREQLLSQAQNLRALAARGMRPRAFIKEAERLEALVGGTD